MLTNATRLGILLLGTYLLILIFFKLMETRLIFLPPELPLPALSARAAQLDATELTVESADGTSLYGWRLGSGEVLVLHFSGKQLCCTQLSRVLKPALLNVPGWQCLLTTGHTVAPAEFAERTGELDQGTSSSMPSCCGWSKQHRL